MDNRLIACLLCALGVTSSSLCAMPPSGKQEKEKDLQKNSAAFEPMLEEEHTEYKVLEKAIEEAQKSKALFAQEAKSEWRVLVEDHKRSINEWKKFASERQSAIAAAEQNLKRRLFETDLSIPSDASQDPEEVLSTFIMIHDRWMEEFKEFKEVQAMGRSLALKHEQKQALHRKAQREKFNKKFFKKNLRSIAEEQEYQIQSMQESGKITPELHSKSLDATTSGSVPNKHPITDEDLTSKTSSAETFFAKLSRIVRREVVPTMFTTAMSAIVYHDYTQYMDNPEVGLSMSIIPASAMALMEARNIANRFFSKEPSPWSLSVPTSLQDTARTGALLLPAVAVYGYSQTLSSGSGANDSELSTSVMRCVQSCLTGMNDL